MSPCPACGHQNQANAKFCSECGSAMAEAPVASREERKVVTVLFADLVGFTSRSERLDPEDVRALLSPYYARLRAELERFGGTVEKFIGDAVMALFGAPVAHEDDPDRAVRAALAIRDWVLEEQVDLQVRIAVNTGEALVALDARPGRGEGMASGDVVNTTARLQTAAPINGILVGESTHRATSSGIRYREAPPVTAKGKAEAIPAWEAIEARSRMGVDLARAIRVPLVGRVPESRVLTDALARTQRERSPQLVTLVGVPGIGKSRLVAELFQAADADPLQIVLWRQGRSLPYGDGVTFWALSEMVKGQAGILETDSETEAEEKLRTAVDDLIADPADARWIEEHLRPLAGVSSGADPTGDRRDEAFTAWRRFFEALAEQNPLVMVFEDLHWADDNLLDFVEHLVDWAASVPLLIVCGTRPELLERRPGWAGSTRNATRLSLSPLTDDETAQLISSLSDRPVMPVETQQALLVRAGGNPLYAEQYVRMLAERSDAQQLPMPETIQGIIAARLDALAPDEKRLLQDAAVHGKVFWLGAVAGALEPRAVEVRLHALERKDFVQRARRSSVANEVEYSFMHVLVRDVAYGQIPRGERADRHAAAAEWIAALGRTEDHAEMLAYHYASALELRRATGRAVEGAFAARALESLRDAGDRAHSLNAYAAAAGFYAAAAELASKGSLDHARLLFLLGRARYFGGDHEPESLEAATAALLECGDQQTAAESEAVLAQLTWLRGDAEAALRHRTSALRLVDAGEPTRVKAYVIGVAARYLSLAGDSEEAIRVGREALAMADELDVDQVRAIGLNAIGVSRAQIGDADGIDDLERAVAIAEAANLVEESVRARGNLASVLFARGDIERSAGEYAGAATAAGRYGLQLYVRWFQGQAPDMHYLRGEWGQAETAIAPFLIDVEAGSPHYLAADLYAIRSLIRLGRDSIEDARADIKHALELARLAKDAQILYPTLARGAQVFAELGDRDSARALADEIIDAVRSGRVSATLIAPSLHGLAGTVRSLGKAQELADLLPHDDLPWLRAASALLAGNLHESADVCGAIGARTEEARDRLLLAQSLLEQDRRPEADVELQQALAFYRWVGASRYVNIAESLFAASA